jgi:two-component system sensor histidine kinase MprB
MSSHGVGGRALAGRVLGLGSAFAGTIFPRRGMPLRRRIAFAAAAAVAIAVALAVVVCYGAVSYRLSSELHSQLTSQATYYQNTFQDNDGRYRIPQEPAYKGGPAPYEELVLANGQPLPGGNIPGGVLAGAAVASGEQSAGMHEVTIDGTRVCVYTFRLSGLVIDGEPVAVELGRPLTQIKSLLHELRIILLVVFLLAVPLAALFGRFAARRVLRPLAEVTDTAEVIAATDDLSRRIDVREDDEVGQLASRFNAMLERLAASREELDESVRSQQQLVADASHELRTPVTSMRTNVEVLLASPSLEEDDRQLLQDVLEQSEELSTLVADLIEVARGELPSDSLDDVRLDAMVEEALIRARRNAPNIEYRASFTPTVVQGNPERLARAVNNLLDNAAKHAGTGPVDVRVDATGLTVRDHGGGIDPSDLPYIFDRFYRGVNSRSSQGSGLGLAIVRQTAEMHGGSVRAANAPGSGAVFTLELPTSAPGESDDDADSPTSGTSGYGAEGLATRA